MYVPKGTKKVLIWDKFSAHTNTDVEKEVKKFSEVFLIPPGCTGLLQPLDTHVNRVVKANFKKLFVKWMDSRTSENTTPSGNYRFPAYEKQIE